MPKDILLIVGVGRSGTSALARVLSLCGCSLPGAVLGVSEFNPKGSWEPVDIWKLNHTFMLRHHTEYGDPTLRLQEMVFDEIEKENYIRQVQMSLAGTVPGAALVVKQPDITELMDFWVEAARREGLSLKILIAIRNPREVFASQVAARWAESIELTNAFWIKRNLLAERHSRNLPRVFVEYSNLMSDWRREVDRIAKALCLELEPDRVAIEEFITPDLHRQRASGPVVETFAYSWVTRVYAILSSAAQDGPIDFPTMDEIYHAYRANERAFRIAWDEFRTRFDRINPKQLQDVLERAPVLNTAISEKRVSK